MKIKNRLNIIAALALYAVAPLTQAQCLEGCNITYYNTFLGDNALIHNTVGSANTASGALALYSNTTGSYNTAGGVGALYSNTTGSNNTASGYAALSNNTTGDANTATGDNALLGALSATGSNNTGTGFDVMLNYTTGSNNTAAGYKTLYSDTTGGSNTATGYVALYFDTAGSYNTAIGRGALYRNTTANYNVAMGYQALNTNTTGTYNTAVGAQALATNATSSYNIALGYQALNKCTGNSNTAIGEAALPFATTGSGNIAVGAGAGFGVSTGSNNIDIGSQGGGESSTIRLGTVGFQTNTYIAGISGVTVAGGIGVIVDSNGHLGTSTSSARYKENIKPMDKASGAIFSLEPVTFRYKKNLDAQGIPQFGLVAEQVEKVDPELVARDSDGKPYSVRYEAVNAMLLNEFLKEHRKVDEQANALRTDENEIAQLKSDLAEQSKDFGARIAQQQKQISDLTAGLQKVSARLESSTAAAKVIADN